MCALCSTDVGFNAGVLSINFVCLCNLDMCALCSIDVGFNASLLSVGSVGLCNVDCVLSAQLTCVLMRRSVA